MYIKYLKLISVYVNSEDYEYMHKSGLLCFH